MKSEEIKDIEEITEPIAVGVYQGIRKAVDRAATYALWGFGIIIVINTARYFTDFGRDSTDPASGPRSGMVIRTDALTGCEYLATSDGGLTPRMGYNGFQICHAVQPKVTQ